MKCDKVQKQILDKAQHFHCASTGTLVNIKMNSDSEQQPILPSASETVGLESNAIDDNPGPLKTHDPTMNRNLPHPTSSNETLVHLLKGSMGPGILSMPHAFKNAGLYVGLFGSMILGFFCTICIQRLAVCSRDLCRRVNVSSMDYADVCYSAFKTGPARFQKYAKTAKFVTNFFICSTQFGTCCVYLVFVATNLQSVISYHWKELDIRIYLTITLVPIILLCFLKNLKILVPVTVLGGLLAIATVVIEFSYILHDVSNSHSVKPSTTFQQLPLFFGTAIFAFEGIAVVLPLENNMATPKDFLGFNGVLNTAMVLMVSGYLASGFFGFLKYGEKTASTILLNFSTKDVLAQMAQIFMLSSIYLSYALQFYVPFNIIRPIIRNAIPRFDDCGIGDAVLRIALVLVTFIIAIAVPNLGPIISLVGSISSSTLALILPPIIHIITYWPDQLGRFKWMFWMDVIILLFGICGSLTGTYASFVAVIHPYTQGGI